jgi:hypothetical protein
MATNDPLAMICATNSGMRRKDNDIPTLLGLIDIFFMYFTPVLRQGARNFTCRRTYPSCIEIAYLPMSALPR